ncbi:MAG: hypothetical protein C4332_15285, partial [Meiothermus sp.]
SLGANPHWYVLSDLAALRARRGVSRGERVSRGLRARFLEPLLEHLGTAGLGHVSEIADGDASYKPNGCPLQAWSLGEVLRLDQQVLSAKKPEGVER